MTRRLVTTLSVALVALTARRTVAAQTAADLLATGMRAYQNLDYDAAATALRRGLARTTSDTLSAAGRLQALTYLGATELFRGQRDSAIAAFRRIAVADPRYRPSELIFPPQVTTVFREVRQTTKAVFVQVPPVTEFRARAERFTARLVASSPHAIAVAITLVDGTPVRPLFTGPIGDSLVVTWDGLTEAGEPVNSGRYLLRVVSRPGAGAAQLVRQLPLEVEQSRSDTLAWSSVAAPPATRSGPAVRSLAGGLLAAAAVVVLPSVVAHDAGGLKGRFAVAAAIGVSGVVSFLAQRPGRRLDTAAAAEAAVRDAGKRRLERADTVRHRGDVHLIVRAGPSTALEQGAP